MYSQYCGRIVEYSTGLHSICQFCPPVLDVSFSQFCLPVLCASSVCQVCLTVLACQGHLPVLACIVGQFWMRVLASSGRSVCQFCAIVPASSVCNFWQYWLPVLDSLSCSCCLPVLDAVPARNGCIGQLWVLLSASSCLQPLPILPLCLFVCLSAQAVPTRTGPDCRRGRPPTDLPTGQPADRSTDWPMFDAVGKVPHHSHFFFLKNLLSLRDGLAPEVISGSMLARMERRLCKEAVERFRPRFAVSTRPRQTVDGAARMLRPFAALFDMCLV